MSTPLQLSICIATYNRGKWIGATLDSIVNQLRPGVEIVIVDGASPDNTADLIRPYLVRYPQIRYYREAVNSGVDQDYDKAVSYAQGKYCWLMTDDDLIQEGGVQHVLSYLDEDRDLVVVNAEVRDVHLKRVFEARRLPFQKDKEYRAEESEGFFSEMADCLGFIGGIVIRRDVWKKRQRSPYYGTLFIHVGVIFQSPALQRIRVIADPCIIIRHGNALWTPHAFKIWMFKWPHLIWAFPHFSDTAKASVCDREPWKRIKVLFLHRGFGSYTPREYHRFIKDRAGVWHRVIAWLISIFPGRAANFLATLYFVLVKPRWHMGLDNLVRSRHATGASRWLTRFLKA